MNQQQQLREAKILFASGQLEKSINSFDRAEEQGSDIIDTCLSRGAAFVALRRFEEAERDFSSVLETDSDNERAYYFRGVARLLRGLAYSELDQSGEAETDFKTVADFSEYEMESFKNVFGVIDSPFKNTKAMLSEDKAPWKNVLSDRSAQMLRNLLDN